MGTRTAVLREDNAPTSRAGRASRRLDPYAVGTLLVGLTGLVVGVWYHPWMATALALLAFTLGLGSFWRIKVQEELTGRGMAITGMVLSIVPLVIALLP